MIEKMFDFVFDKLLEKIWAWFISTGLLTLLIILFNNLLFLRVFSFIFLILSVVSIFIAHKLCKENKNLKSKLDNRTIEHDKKIFEESDEIMSETQLKDLNENLFNGYCYREQVRTLDNFICYFKNTGKNYLNENLKNSSHKLIKALNDMNCFSGQHFFSNSDVTRYNLYPELKYTKEEFWQEKLNKLRKLIDIVEKYYDEYRTTIKNELHI